MLSVFQPHNSNFAVNFVKEHILKPEIEHEVKRVVKEIKQLCSTTSIYLFGSAADNESENIRDLDFLVAIPDTLDFKSYRKKILCQVTRTTWALDLIVVPESFLKEKIALGGNFYAFAVQEGILLHEAA